MTTPKDDELDELQTEIDEARRKATDDGVIDGEHEQRFYDSGDSTPDNNAPPAP
ncbi:MAG TPA: hypothetical protein VGJ03_06690 [Acidimicrobiales bacterium]|jgi:hypothetical protein